MLVTLYPGANRQDVLRTLRDLQSEVQNSGNVHGPAQARVSAYLEWATNAVRMLEHRISAADVDRLVLTRSYDRLFAAAGSLTGADISTQRVLNGLVNSEVLQRSQVLDDAIRELDAQGRRWPQGVLYAVADTSFYIEHDAKLKDTDFAPLLARGWFDKPITILVPIIVLDELDGLKQRGGTTYAKWRASYTLAVFDDIFTDPGAQSILRQPIADGTRGPVWMDIVYDPPRHERLPINDDEIIDRALAAQSTAGSPLTLLTYDTSQAARARHAGLAVNKLTKPLEDEPQDTRGKKRTGHPPDGRGSGERQGHQRNSAGDSKVAAEAAGDGFCDHIDFSVVTDGSGRGDFQGGAAQRGGVGAYDQADADRGRVA